VVVDVKGKKIKFLEQTISNLMDLNEKGKNTVAKLLRESTVKRRRSASFK
jgi:hypothetical protein